MQSGKKSIVFSLSIIGGILIIVNSILSVVMLTSYGVNYGFFGGMMGGMMGGFTGMMGSWGFPFGLMTGFMIAGLIAGIVVLLGSVMLYFRPSEHFAWGVVILVFSVISFLGMGGFVIGAILGIVGGALAVS
jgi:hypothetical protein